MNDYEKTMKELEQEKKRNMKIKELAKSFLEQMTKLELTYREYEYLKYYLDDLINNLIIPNSRFNKKE